MLPFVNLSSDPESEYFSDGMTEELISALTKVKGLRVTARGSAFAFKGKDVDVREIGQRLNVVAVLEGSIRRAGDRLRITAQLINSTDGFYVWSETFDRGMADVFAVQDELSRAITASLKVRLTPDQEQVSEPPTENLDAYTAYLKGLHHLNRRTLEGYRVAVEFFQSAQSKDPSYALPHAGTAHAYTMLGFDWYGGMSALEAMPLARAAVTRALQLDPDLVEAHTAQAMIRMLFEWNWEEQRLASAGPSKSILATLRRITGFRNFCRPRAAIERRWPRSGRPRSWIRCRSSSTRMRDEPITRRAATRTRSNSFSELLLSTRGSSPPM